MNKDDYIRALRALFREIVRSLRHDINFSAFCLGLMQERTEQKFTELEQVFRVIRILRIYEPIVRKPVLRVSDQLRHKSGCTATEDGLSLEFLIKKVEGLYYLCSKNKAADHLCGYHTTDLRVCFHICKNWFSLDLVYIITTQLICVFVFTYAKIGFLLTWFI